MLLQVKPVSEVLSIRFRIKNVRVLVNSLCHSHQPRASFSLPFLLWVSRVGTNGDGKYVKLNRYFSLIPAIGIRKLGILMTM